MKILGQYAELANLQKSIRKDDNQSIKEESVNTAGTSRTGGDVAELSDSARKMAEVHRIANKLKEIPDPREEKVNDVISRLRSGALLSPTAVKSSISRMLDSGILL